MAACLWWQGSSGQGASGRGDEDGEVGMVDLILQRRREAARAALGVERFGWGCLRWFSTRKRGAKDVRWCASGGERGKPKEWRGAALLCQNRQRSTAMLIFLKRIYNFWCSMLVYTPFPLCFVYTSWHFYAFSRTNLLTRCHSASSLFSAIFVFQKSYTGNILGIGQNKSWSS
jgi:hypothetical protein